MPVVDSGGIGPSIIFNDLDNVEMREATARDMNEFTDSSVAASVRWINSKQTLLNNNITFDKPEDLNSESDLPTIEQIKDSSAYLQGELFMNSSYKFMNLDDSNAKYKSKYDAIAIRDLGFRSDLYTFPTSLYEEVEYITTGCYGGSIDLSIASDPKWQWGFSGDYKIMGMDAEGKYFDNKAPWEAINAANNKHNGTAINFFGTSYPNILSSAAYTAKSNKTTPDPDGHFMHVPMYTYNGSLNGKHGYCIRGWSYGATVPSVEEFYINEKPGSTYFTTKTHMEFSQEGIIVGAAEDDHKNERKFATSEVTSSDGRLWRRLWGLKSDLVMTVSDTGDPIGELHQYMSHMDCALYNLKYTSTSCFWLADPADQSWYSALMDTSGGTNFINTYCTGDVLVPESGANHNYWASSLADNNIYRRAYSGYDEQSEQCNLYLYSTGMSRYYNHYEYNKYIPLTNLQSGDPSVFLIDDSNTWTYLKKIVPQASTSGGTSNIHRWMWRKTRVYSRFKIWKDFDLAGYFITVRRKSDGLYGVYNTVTKTFHYNKLDYYILHYGMNVNSASTLGQLHTHTYSQAGLGVTYANPNEAYTALGKTNALSQWEYWNLHITGPVYSGSTGTFTLRLDQPNFVNGITLTRDHLNMATNPVNFKVYIDGPENNMGDVSIYLKNSGTISDVKVSNGLRVNKTDGPVCTNSGQNKLLSFDVSVRLYSYTTQPDGIINAPWRVMNFHFNPGKAPSGAIIDVSQFSIPIYIEPIERNTWYINPTNIVLWPDESIDVSLIPVYNNMYIESRANLPSKGGIIYIDIAEGAYYLSDLYKPSFTQWGTADIFGNMNSKSGTICISGADAGWMCSCPSTGNIYSSLRYPDEAGKIQYPCYWNAPGGGIALTDAVTDWVTASPTYNTPTEYLGQKYIYELSNANSTSIDLPYSEITSYFINPVDTISYGTNLAGDSIVTTSLDTSINTWDKTIANGGDDHVLYIDDDPKYLAIKVTGRNTDNIADYPFLTYYEEVGNKNTRQSIVGDPILLLQECGFLPTEGKPWGYLDSDDIIERTAEGMSENDARVFGVGSENPPILKYRIYKYVVNSDARNPDGNHTLPPMVYKNYANTSTQGEIPEGYYYLTFTTENTPYYNKQSAITECPNIRFIRRRKYSPVYFKINVLRTDIPSNSAEVVSQFVLYINFYDGNNNIIKTIGLRIIEGTTYNNIFNGTGFIVDQDETTFEGYVDISQITQGAEIFIQDVWSELYDCERIEIIKSTKYINFVDGSTTVSIDPDGNTVLIQDSDSGTNGVWSFDSTPAIPEFGILLKSLTIKKVSNSWYTGIIGRNPKAARSWTPLTCIELEF